MYFNILKKELKRKKTMNFILLIFIAMASMFVSSSVNNMISILNATDNYFERANLADYYVITGTDEENAENEEKVQTFFKENSQVESFSVEELLYVPTEEWRTEHKKKISINSSAMVMSLDTSKQKFFDKNNQQITKMKDDEIYLPLKVMEESELKAGDILYLSNHGKEAAFTVAGNAKDALMGSPMMGVNRVIVNDKGYEKIKELSELKGMIYAARSAHPEKVEEAFNQKNVQVMFNEDRDLIKMTYVMDMVSAGLMLVVSICLILISMVILRFTILFTLNEEYREIGVMKAIGMEHSHIRNIYLVKYLIISVVGAGIGFFGGIPFGNVFLAQVSKNMVMETVGNIWLLNLVCSVLVVLVVVLFCYRCTGKVKKISPIDAIRDGSNGERFTKKGFLRLEKWRGRPVSFLSLHDIGTRFRSFVVLLVIFTLGNLLILVTVNTVNTLNSDQLVVLFGMKEADLCILNEEKDNRLIREEGERGVSDSFAEMEETMRDHGISAKVSQEVYFKLRVSFQEKSQIVFCIQGNGSTTDEYMYDEGTVPEYENEIAITKMTAEHIGAKLGDTITITIGEEEREYLITAYYQSMNNMGEGVRFSEKADIDYRATAGTFARQLVYKDNPSEKEREGRKEEITKLFKDYEVSTGGEYISKMMGNIAETFDSIRQLIVVVIMAINMLVAILVSKAFLTKERGEIGMLKAIGFDNGSLICWQVLRIGMILVLSAILGALLSNPVAQISSGKVFEMMGATHIEFVIKPLEVYVVYPLLALAATMVGTIISVQQIRRISAQETNNIE